MSRHATAGLLALALCAVSGATPPAASAQQARPGVAVTQDTRGWLGIRFGLEVRSLRSGDEPELTMRINDVQEGSPAARAGIQPGDTVLRIDGRPVSTATLEAVFGGLAPGDHVRLTLRRSGRALETSVVAGSRPSTITVSPTVSVRLDSMTNAIVARMDSARISLERGGVAVVRGSGSREWVRIHPDTLHRVWTFEGRNPLHADSLHFFPQGRAIVSRMGGVSDPTETIPFELFLFDSQEANALRREMARVQRELQRVGEAESRRLQELARARQQIDQSDARLRELRELEAELQLEMARMQEQIERARDEARRVRVARIQEIQEQSRQVAEATRRAVAEHRADFRPLSLYAAGQNMVAGARLTELNPALAEYFEVESGVLVTEVLEDTPAADAPLVAGDVIVAVGDAPVADLSDLRAALVRGSGESSLTVVRKGRRVRVTLPRE